MFKKNCVAFVGAVLLSLRVVALAQAPAPQIADALFQTKKWAEAARAYESIVQAEPTNARAWYRLGISLLAQNQFQAAAPPLEKAVAISSRPEAMYALAQAYARLGDKDKAFYWLDKALTAKLSQATQIEQDPNLGSLHDDVRFAHVKEMVERVIHPCKFEHEYKQFDFWVGEWRVTAEGQKVATSSIQRIVDSCIILENYSQADGFVGKSFNFYDASLHKWRQTWVDGGARASEFVGEYKDGAMRFEGESHLSDGTKILRRMALFNLSPSQVRQLSYASTDGGQTWHVTYDFTYTRSSGIGAADPGHTGDADMTRL